MITWDKELYKLDENPRISDFKGLSEDKFFMNKLCFSFYYLIIDLYLILDLR